MEDVMDVIETEIKTLGAPIATFDGEQIDQRAAGIVSFRMTIAEAMRLGEELLSLKDLPADAVVQVMADEEVTLYVGRHA